MHVKFIRVAAAFVTLFWTCAGAQAQTASLLGASPTGSGSVRIPLARQRPGLRPSRLPSGAAAAPAYTIVSFGAPTVNSEPVAFNNTGQVAGYGATGCYVYDSGSFSRLPIPSAATQYVDCEVASISDKDAGGSYQIGGTTGNPYAGSRYAFAVTPRTPIVYYGYENSVVLGINNNGTSLVSALFVPVRTTDLSGQQYFTATGGGGYLAQVQAPASSVTRVHYLLPFLRYATPPCPFGGCVINDLNEILGYDPFTLTDTSASLALYSLGNPASLVDLPISLNATDGFIYGLPPVAFNDRNQILYNADQGRVPAVYDIGSKKTTIIPLVTPNCPKGGYGEPLSMNNKGEVLGTYFCNNNNFSGYFTWDAASGTHDLSVAIPNTNFTLYPIGVNDSGAILIELTAGYFNTRVSWGMLEPVTSSSAKARTAATLVTGRR